MIQLYFFWKSNYIGSCFRRPGVSAHAIFFLYFTEQVLFLELIAVLQRRGSVEI